MVEETASRANIGINEPCVGRILPPMRELVAIGIQDGIAAERLNGALPGRLLKNE
jgi:hypothetical protein